MSYNNSIFVMGGYDSDGSLCNDLFQLNTGSSSLSLCFWYCYMLLLLLVCFVASFSSSFCFFVDED